jgi:hypothetical protein
MKPFQFALIAAAAGILVAGGCYSTVNDEMAATGTISAETRKRIDDLNERCNSAYLTSFDLIASNPTPGLNGYSETWDARRYNDVSVYNQNLRALADEWSRLWLVNYPSGTPYNTYNPTGRF